MNLEDNNLSKISLDSDSKFLEDYWLRYKKILFESRDDNLILKLRDDIRNTCEKGGKLIFFW